MRHFLQAGNTAIDVGAYIGDLAIPMSHLVGDAGRLIAFEAHPHNFNVLCANLALNNIRNTQAINAFVALPDAASCSVTSPVVARWPVDCSPASTTTD